MKSVNIAYSTSDLYAQCTGVSLLSLLENNRDMACINIYILDSDVKEINRERLRSIARRYDRNITFISAQEHFKKRIGGLGAIPMRGAYNTYARIMMNTWFENLDKILLIDSDTLIVDSIKELWDTDIGSSILAAVPDIAVYAKGSIGEDWNLIKQCNPYYNMGVVLFDLEKWRSEDVDSKIEHTVLAQNGEFQIADQSILNKSLNDRIRRLHLRYNFYTAAHIVSYRTMIGVFSEENIFSRKEFVEARQHPAIIHFVGHAFERPWYRDSATPFRMLYSEYRKKTPWKDFPLLPNPTPKNLVFGLYDLVVYSLLRIRLNRFAFWFRYILGQKIKRALKQRR
jgi:lipopolysaccharide biosynthesis glycosyltransferase